jgi:hypothetical protein
MATIKEYFDKAFEQVLTASRRVSLQAPAWGVLDAIVQVHFDFDAPARYLSVFIPRNEHWKNACVGLLSDPSFLLALAGDVNLRLPHATFVYGGFKIVNSSPAEIEARPLCEAPINATELPFTGTVFVYCENEASAEEVVAIKASATRSALRVRWRGPSFARERSLIEKPIAFISHDSRDKQDVARPMAIRLQQLLCPVWFDEFSLGVGDSLREKIEKGLKECCRCILVLSPSFLANQGWTKAEFDSVFTREILAKESVMLPVWNGVTAKDVYEYSPRLADKVGVDWSLGVEEVCRRLYQSIAKATMVPTPSVWKGE